MASLSNVLASIPGYGAFVARREMNEQAGQEDIKNAAALQAIYASIQEQQRQQQAAAQTQGDRARAEAVRMKIAALPPEQRTRENVLPLLMEAASPKDVAGMLPAGKEFQSVGAGGLYDVSTGSVIPPAARPDATPKAPAVRQRYDGENVIQEELQADGTYKEIGRGPRFAPKAEPAPQPITPVTVVRDGKQVVIDGRTGRVIGDAAPKAGGADAGMTPENAGKVAMSQQAVEGIGTVRGIIFDKDGNMNRNVIGAMNLPIVAGLPGNSQARIARTAIRNAVEAKLRIETGAAATESEVERTLARFLPTIADTKESAKFKLDELEKFFKSSLSLTKGVKAPAPAENDPLGIRR